MAVWLSMVAVTRDLGKFEVFLYCAEHSTEIFREAGERAQKQVLIYVLFQGSCDLLITTYYILLSGMGRRNCLSTV